MKNTNKIILTTLLIILVCSAFYFLHTKKVSLPEKLNNINVSLNNEKIDIFLCAENYSVDELYVNKKPSTKDILESTVKAGYRFCSNPKSETNDTLAINKINENLINVIYRDVKYEYVIDKDFNVSLINDYDGSLTEIHGNKADPKLHIDEKIQLVNFCGKDYEMRQIFLGKENIAKSIANMVTNDVPSSTLTFYGQKFTLCKNEIFGVGENVVDFTYAKSKEAYVFKFYTKQNTLSFSLVNKEFFYGDMYGGSEVGPIGKLK
jgi:hypothetical protein